MATLPLSQGLVAFIDDADLEAASAFNWVLDRRKRSTYAKRRIRKPDGTIRHQYLHVFLMGQPGVDHINGDGLDNRRENLRIASSAQNNANRRKRSGTTSKYKGVSRSGRSSTWQAHIKVAGRSIHLGSFADETAAAKAYDAAALKHQGEFALINFPRGC